MQALILYGGLASRLGSLTEDCPKYMVKIQGKPFINIMVAIINNEALPTAYCVTITCAGDRIKETSTGELAPGEKCGAGDGIRTRDTLLGRQELFR